VDEDLTVRARIDDELSAPLEDIGDKVRRVGDEAASSGTRASRGSRGWDTFGRAAEKAGRLAKRAAIAVAAGAAAAGYAAFQLARSSINEASSLNESLNAVNVTYGKQAKAVKKLGREAAKSVGMSNVEFNGMAVQFAAFAQAVGGEGKGSVKVLDDLTTRAADFASVMNIEVAEAAALFQSGLAGESEPLRKYGIDLSAAAVGAYAFKSGISESATEMTAAEKVQATYGLLMEKTAVTQGDFANTSDSLANQQRILGSRFKDAQAKLGKGLLPMMTTAVRYLNRDGIPAFLRFSDWFTEKGIPAIGRFVDKAQTFYEKHGPAIKDTLADVKDVAGTAADAAERLVEAFLGMPSWARKALIGGAIGGATAAKLGLLKPGAQAAAGLVTGGVQKVFVVNQLPGGGAGTGVGAAAGGGAAATWGAKAAAAIKFGLTRGSIVLAGVTIADAIIPDPEKNDVLNPVGDLGRKHGDAVRKFFRDGALGGGSDRSSTPAAVDAINATPAMSIDGNDLDRVRTAIGRTAEAMDTVRAKAAGFGTELDLVGARKVNPTVKRESIDRANTALARFIDAQVDAGRPVAPYITINGYDRAMSQIATLTTAIHSIPTAGVDNGLTFASGGTPDATPRREYGGSVKAGKPYVVGERRAELFVPNRSGTIIPRVAGSRAGGGDTITIERIEVNNPTSNVDVERAVEAGIRRYVRDREERS
jgi:hypothetical protein